MNNTILNVENLSVTIDEKKILDSITFSIERSTINAVLCPNNGGKTTLIKAISGIIYSNDGIVSLDNIVLSKNNLDKFIVKISTILDDIENQFIFNKVDEELQFPLDNLSYEIKDKKKLIDEVVNLTKISTDLGKSIFELSYVEKIKVLIAASIIHKPCLLLIDDIFRFLKIKEKKEILKILKNINEKLNITILFTTSDLNDVIDFKNIILLNNGKIEMQDSFDNIIFNDNELSKIGFQIPLMIDLSRKLQFYNLVDKIYYDPDKVVDKLWN